jgi:hypothetical protein
MTCGRVDPVLKLFPGCPLMLTENKDVCNGQANGSRVKLQRIIVKQGEQEIIVKLSCGAQVRAFFASQIAAISVRHEIDDVVPRDFDLTPRRYSFSAKVFIDGVKRTLRMKDTQFQLSAMEPRLDTSFKDVLFKALRSLSFIILKTGFMSSYLE